VSPPPERWEAWDRWIGRPGTARYFAADAGLRFALNAAFPRLSYRARWPTRLSPRGTALYVLAATATSVSLRVLLPLLPPRLETAVRELAGEELRTELGRDPTPDEVTARMEAHGWTPRPGRRA